MGYDGGRTNGEYIAQGFGEESADCSSQGELKRMRMREWLVIVPAVA